MLRYWTQMHNEEGVEPTSDDGLRKPEDELCLPDYVTWEPVNCHYQGQLGFYTVSFAFVGRSNGNPEIHMGKHRYQAY